MTKNPTDYEIKENDEQISNILDQTNSPKIASIIKSIQILESGRDRYRAIELVKQVLG